MTISRASLMAFLLLVPVACQPAEQEEAAHSAESAVIGDSATPAHGHAAADTSGLEPKPLLPIMQQLAVDMAALTHALFTDDYPAVTQRAAAVANHAPIAAADLQRIDAALGADMAEFETLDAATHSASVKLHEAATAQNVSAVLDQLSEVQASCVACHARFRERLRTNK